MTDIPDREVLAEFARSESEPAFAELVRRHIALVHSVALRHTDNPQHAQEITQAVFIILARKAASLGQKTVLSGWLYHTARLTAANFRRAEFRRIRREQEAFMQSTIEENSPDAAWQELAPLLDDAMAHLGATDRDAVVLRYFENKSLSEVGVALGMEERAAQKRVSRALEKLRRIFTKSGVILTTTVIADAVTANSVQAAPLGLAVMVTAAAAKGAAVSGSTLTLIKGALKIMAWTKAKTAIVVGVGVLLAAGTATVVVKEFSPLTIDEKWFETNGDSLAKVPDNLKIIRPTHFGKGGGSSMRGMSERIVCKNMTLEWGLVFAHQFHSYRLAFPNDFPRNRYDYLITFPHGPGYDGQDGPGYDGQEKVRNAVKDVIEKQFGFVAHRETREREVLLLRVINPTAAGLQKPAQGDEFSGGAIQSSVEGLNAKNFSLDNLAGQLENHLQIPVLDQTGLTNRIALDLRWKKLPGETVADTTKRVVLDQLGLELVSSRAPIEMLVVEKTK